MGQRPDIPPFPYRARPPQVLLGVGALLVVSCAAALAGALGGEPARVGLVLAAAAAAAWSVRSALRPLPSSAETLAACAVALALIGGGGRTWPHCCGRRSPSRSGRGWSWASPSRRPWPSSGRPGRRSRATPAS